MRVFCPCAADKTVKTENERLDENVSKYKREK
jgi:hypothetical protein